MAKCLKPRRLLLALALCLLAIEGRAQAPDPKARAAEWQSYKLPATPFARYAKTDTALLVFRVPVEWKQQGDQLVFASGNDLQLRVIAEEIPDGVPLRAYVASLLGALRKLPGGDADAVTVRRTEISGLEAREVMFEMAEPRGGLSRRLIWSTVDGPRVVSFILIEPQARAAEIEPQFKAVIESTIVSGAGPNILFEVLHKSEFNANQPVRMDEALGLVPALDGTAPAERARAIARLSELFARVPESVIDLTIDRRAMVRAAAIEALAASGNRALVKFLLRATNDPDAFVADRAAAAFAKLPDAVAMLREETQQWADAAVQPVLNATAYLDRKARAQIAAELFKAGRPGVFHLSASNLPPKRLPPPPPPPASGRKPTAPKGPTLNTVKVAEPGSDEAMEWVAMALLHNRQFIAVNLLRDVPPAELKLPLEEIIAAHNDGLTATALQVALERRESLPLESLLKLLDSESAEVRRLAARSVGEAATAADIARLEARAQKLTAPPAAKIADDLRAAVKIIRLREELGKATGAGRRQLLEQAMRDQQIADWVWSRLARDEFEGAKNDTVTAPAQRAVAPLGDNVFPANVQHYVALPQPGAAVGRLVTGLTNLQMPTARSQSDLVLALNAWGELIARFVGAPSAGETLNYLGIKLDAPIAMASWIAADAPRPLASAERKAVVLRVSDRARFERFLTLYEKQFGSFRSLPDYMAFSTRFISLAPAMLPFAARMMTQDNAATHKPSVKVRFDYVARDTCLGYDVKVIAQQEIKQGRLEGDAIYLAYVGDAAVLAPDWHSLRDALTRLHRGGPTVADNAEFKAAVAEGGDAIYFSNLGEVLTAIAGGHASASRDDTLSERGALRLTNAAWESGFRLSFKPGEQPDGTVTFQPAALDAPRRLLPRSTFAYVFLQLDMAAAWRGWLGGLIGADDRKAFAGMWAMDFERDVLPELGPECGAALLGLPVAENEKWDVPGVVFFKLKSDRLARAFAEGKLLNGTLASPGVMRVKWGTSEMLMTVRDGFLIIAADEKTLKRLDGQEKLAAAPDFARAAKAAPAGIFAFGGYNLEAAIAEVSSASDPVMDEAVSVLTSVARAFHSQNLYATASRDHLDAHMTVSLDREGRYSVAELSAQSKDFRPTFAIVEARGAMIADQNRLESLKLRIRARTAAALERIKDDLAVDTQSVSVRGDKELLVNVRPRRAAQVAPLELPVTAAEFAPFLKAVREIRSDDPRIIEQARQIAGTDKDAWSVARKLADWTYKNIRWKRVDSATAVDTLATREADCVEFSQLFVAMARALGLPARLVSGMAYSGGSFGGHAWVEVYAGRWIELDPTWGTDFVDATHVRGASGDLLNYALLNLVEVEVLDAPRAVMDYERAAPALAEKICEELGQDDSTALGAMFDAAALTEAQLSAGAWERLDEGQRQRVTALLPRLAYQLTAAFRSSPVEAGPPAHVLKVRQNDEQAEATVMLNSQGTEMLVKLQLARRGGRWVLIEVSAVETGYHLIKESLRPALDAISARRDGKPSVTAYSDHQRAFALLAMYDTKGALGVAEEVLKKQPDDRVLLNVKALCLSRTNKIDEAVKLWTQLSQAEPPLASAVYNLATHYESSKEADEQKRAVELYRRYITLEPDDPRPHSDLAGLLSEANDAAGAEAEFRTALALDPRSTSRRLDLAAWLVSVKRFDDGLALIDEGVKQYGIKDDLLAELLTRFLGSEEGEAAEALAAAHPERIAASAEANLTLAAMRSQQGHYAEALPLLKRALVLKPDNLEARDAQAEAYRKLQNWAAALQAADAAIAVKAEDAEAHYHRACALARLGRLRQAVEALKRAIELDEGYAEEIADEADLRPLARLPEFKALIPKAEPAPAKKEPNKQP